MPAVCYGVRSARPAGGREGGGRARMLTMSAMTPKLRCQRLLPLALILAVSAGCHRKPAPAEETAAASSVAPQAAIAQKAASIVPSASTVKPAIEALPAEARPEPQPAPSPCIDAAEP